MVEGGYQLLRVDVTTGPDGHADKLRLHLKALLRRVVRELGYEEIQTFVLETSEGHGVLHMVWAWKGDRSFYLPQAWLSDEWNKIHGAPVVWVKRMGGSRTDQQRVNRYFVTQYLSDQRGALVRMTYSWHKLPLALARGWERVKRYASHTYEDERARFRWRRVYVFPMAEVIACWQAILREGEGWLGDTMYRVVNRELVPVSSYEARNPPLPF